MASSPQESKAFRKEGHHPQLVLARGAGGAVAIKGFCVLLLLALACLLFVMVLYNIFPPAFFIFPFLPSRFFSLERFFSGCVRSSIPGIYFEFISIISRSLLFRLCAVVYSYLCVWCYIQWFSSGRCF